MNCRKLLSAYLRFARARHLTSFCQPMGNVSGFIYGLDSDYFTNGRRGSVSFHVDFNHKWLASSVTASMRELPARKFK
jgi:hypothetical protein